MGQLLRWAPDANGHCNVLRDWSCERARLQFGMSPLQISSAAASWGAVDADDGALLLAAKPSTILNCLRELRRTEMAPIGEFEHVELPWWPCMREVSEAMRAAEEVAEA